LENSINNNKESEVTLRFLQDASHENFSMVVDEQMEMIRRLTYRVVLNEHDADDITQETFISAYQDIGKFQQKAKFTTWLCRIAHNKAYSYLRTSKNRFDNHSDLEIEAVASKNNNPDNRMETIEEHEKIHKALAGLPEHLRSAILLITIDEIPIEEAVYILNCKKATLYWRLHKARKMLKVALG
jgi:RNA polymerase sigma-70 factor, ECF subfamily